MFNPGDVPSGTQATHAPAPLHTGVVPPQSALVAHCVSAQEPSARQKAGAGHVLLPGHVWGGAHPTHVPLTLHTGVVPPHWAADVHCRAWQKPPSTQNGALLGQVPCTALTWATVHATQVPVASSQTGVEPPHWAADVHATHVLLALQ